MENLDNWRKAGKIAAEALAYGKSLIRPGASLLEVTEKIEKKISELGGVPAFPVQISCNEIAAHYCAYSDDKIIFKDQLINLDIGVSIEGMIGDTACCIDLSGKNKHFVEAAEKALEAAIEAVKQKKSLGEIGKAIQEAIESYGLSPVRNLSGHGLTINNIHTSPSIPNYDNHDSKKLKDQFIAIEPFATNGKGLIYESGEANIFSLKNKKPLRNPVTRKILKEIESYEGKPFCTRWLEKKFHKGYVNLAIREMLNLDMLNEYPPLPDQNKGLVSQAEHSLYIDKDGKVEILTKL